MPMHVRQFCYHGNSPPVSYSVCVSNATVEAAAADDADWSSCQHGSHWEEIVETEKVVTQLQPLTLYRVVIRVENAYHDVTRNSVEMHHSNQAIFGLVCFVSHVFKDNTTMNECMRAL